MNPAMVQTVAFPFGITQFGMSTAIQVPVSQLMATAPLMGNFIQSGNIPGMRDQLNSLRIPLIHQADALQQFAAALGFTESIEPEHVESLVGELGDSIANDMKISDVPRHFLAFRLSTSQETRSSSIEMLRSKGEFARQYLASMMLDVENNEGTRHDAVAALASLGASSADNIIDLLSVENPNVSFYAMWAIDQLGVDAVKPLMSALTDPRPLVRRNAAQALANIGEPAVNALIDKILTSGKAVPRVTWGQKTVKRDSVVEFGAAKIPVRISDIIERQTRGLFSEDRLEVAETADALVKKGAAAVEILIDVIQNIFRKEVEERRKVKGRPPSDAAVTPSLVLTAIGEPSVRPFIDLYDTINREYTDIYHGHFDFLIENALVTIGKEHPDVIVEAALFHPSQAVRDAARKWITEIKIPAFDRLAEILRS